jgi:hypothetical protein
MKIAVTNSSCENFFPGHAHGPEDQGINALSGVDQGLRLKVVL